MSSNKVQLVSYREGRTAPEPRILKTRQISLGKLLRMYRERKREQISRLSLAKMLDVSSRTIRNWENDISLPTSQHLRRLLEVYLELKLFTSGKEAEEAQELWLNRQEQDELNTFPGFDEVWFSQLLAPKPIDIPEISNNGLNHLANLSTNQQNSSLNPVEGKTEPPNNLPRLNGPTIGRDKELAQLQTLLQNPEVRLVTLVGPGGVGKTRLVLQTGHALANKFEDGVFFICLAAIDEPALVLEMIAQALGIKEVSGLSLLQTLEAYLATKQILLIIDNFEQVKSAARSLTNLLAAAPGLKFLVGSRITLQIYSEQVFELLPLALPPVEFIALNSAETTLSKYGAMELLLQRAKQVKPDLTMTLENALALTQICQRLDGLPLALELAAARLRYFTPQALLRRLEGAYNSSPLQLLEKGGKDGPTRQQSLRQTLDWSYNLLEADEQFLFCTLAIFNDGCSLVACETVCTSFQNESGALLEPSKVLNLLTQLVEKSLLRHENDPDGEPRFTMLQIVREYALERLKSNGTEEILWQKCTNYFVKLTETSASKSREPEQSIWVARLEKEHNNLRAVLHHALEYLQIEIALQLVVSLWWFWEFQGYLTEGLRWAEEILAQSEALQDDPTISELRVKALNKVDGLSHYNALSSKE